MKRTLALLILFVYVVLAFSQNDSPFMGIGHQMQDDGMKISRIVPGSPADIAGLLANDLVISINGSILNKENDLTKVLEDKSPGDLLKLNVDRCGNQQTIKMILGRREDYQGTMTQGGRETFPTSGDSLMTNWRDNDITKLMFNAIEKAKFDNEYNLLADSAFNVELQAYKGFYTLDAVALPLMQPASVYSSGEWIKSNLAVSDGIISVLEGIPVVLDEYDEEKPLNLRTKPIRTEHNLTYDDIDRVFIDANNNILTSFENLTQDELQLIADIAPMILNTFSETVYIHNESDEELVEEYKNVVNLTKKIDYYALLTSVTELVILAESIKNTGITPKEANSDSIRDILVDREILLGEIITETGDTIVQKARFLITGEQSRTYDEQAAIWIDLGGDDVYLGYCGGTPYKLYDNYKHDFSSGRVGLHIDLGGNDTYIRNTPGSIGGGLCGAGILVDFDGDDTYNGDRLAMGAGFAGVGVLIDHNGDDRYISQESSMGFAVFGAGILYDSNGDDLYHGARYVQGVGVSKGCGILADINGNDQYIAAFKSPNGYGNIDSWDGWSQGVGMGFRSVSAGGIGLLTDRSGDDYYEAGNFSQACGYFFGFGIFEDGSGDDIVIGNRYTQGAGAHQAVSYFRDHAGNDSYKGREAMNQGGAWDIMSAVFIDDAGDDCYEGASYAQGGTAMTAFAAFIDRVGDDKYKSGNISNGDGGALTYHQNYPARNITISIDMGGDDDYELTHSPRKNNKFMTTDDDEKPETGDGIFWDFEK